MASVDHYLIHSFQAVEDERRQKGIEAADGLPAVLPMLVHVTTPSVAEAIAAVEDCRVTSQLGDIIACAYSGIIDHRFSESLTSGSGNH